jgi:hypothetical protein
MSAGRPNFSCIIPPPIREKLEKYTKETGFSMTTVVNVALLKYFDSHELQEAKKSLAQKIAGSDNAASLLPY